MKPVASRAVEAVATKAAMKRLNKLAKVQQAPLTITVQNKTTVAIIKLLAMSDSTQSQSSLLQRLAATSLATPTRSTRTPTL